MFHLKFAPSKYRKIKWFLKLIFFYWFCGLGFFFFNCLIYSTGCQIEKFVLRCPYYKRENIILHLFANFPITDSVEITKKLVLEQSFVIFDFYLNILYIYIYFAKRFYFS